MFYSERFTKNKEHKDSYTKSTRKRFLKTIKISPCLYRMKFWIARFPRNTFYCWEKNEKEPIII